MKYFLWFYNNNNTKVNRNISKNIQLKCKCTTGIMYKYINVNIINVISYPN